MMEVKIFQNEYGEEPYAKWLSGLKDLKGKSCVLKAMAKMEGGLFGDFKSVGGGVQEHRIHYGPGYRLYFGFDGPKLIILLAGSDKGRQKKEIERAKECWVEYKRQKVKMGNAVRKKGVKS